MISDTHTQRAAKTSTPMKRVITPLIMMTSALMFTSSTAVAKPTKTATKASQTTSDHRAGVPHPFFWEVVSPRGARGYFMGTMHVPDERWERFPPEMIRDLDQADALYTEIDLKDKASLSAQLFARAMLKGKTLKDVIGDKLYQRVDAYLKQRGQSAMYMNSMHPKMVEMTLGLLEIMPLLQSGKPALDEWLMNRARKAGKITGGVETVDEQLDALLGGTMEEAVSSLSFTIKHLEDRSKSGIETFKLLIEAYFSGDEERVDSFMKSELKGAPPALLKSMDRLLQKRNRVMAKRLMKMMDEHPNRKPVFAFGVAHFTGDESVIDLVRAKGYKVTRRFAPKR